MSGTSADLLSPVAAGTVAAEATSAEAWVRALIDAEAALARAQARLGLIPGDVANALAGARIDPADLAVRARGAGNPVVPLVAALREVAGDQVHAGATSQDIMDTAAMLVASRVRAAILADLGRTADALTGLARRHRDTPMAGRTLGQQAVPTTFGLRAAGWLAAVAEARDRLAAVRLPTQLGGAAGTLAALGTTELLPLFAEETGLAEPVLPWHTLRAPVAELGAALALVAGALGKIATDVVLLAQTEIGEVAEPAAPGRGGSSAMPHKRNPVLATMIRSAALRVPAYVQILLAAQAAGLDRPTGEWHAEWQPFNDCLRLVGGAAETAAELTAGLEVFPDRMRANLREELLAEYVAGRLAEREGRAAAKETVARDVREGRPLGDLLPRDDRADGGTGPASAPRGGSGRRAEAAGDDGSARSGGPGTAFGVDLAEVIGRAPELVDRALDAYGQATEPERIRGE
ncbi:3-carboxy-cis,cis-muconate cycloisomerase [Actinoallomurus spadix]|uniref:3-carboxy-cis,cis-muconate cycloisomerase n=1 Tax=Actinoallomurus spadix TaxID=79912 RepID=A0ABN0X2W8_9ACTN|nr:3-carboxy-cis,cis-muconate cycloisomerase [Actinoallomurus spadix]MCO5989523.1 3-carboxy-cis,cis-muconate cycloisomerase [Actinoallomurus spadix]